MKQYIIHEQLVTALLQYMSSRPYAEVSQGIEALKGLQEYTSTTKEDVKNG